MPNSERKQRLARVKLALDGLSVGDAFGQQFFFAPNARELISTRTPPPGPWPYTDDTEMALAIAEVLEEKGEIDQDLLAAVFARRYQVDPHRGYGAGAHQLLQQICEGRDWRQAGRELFGGQGSFGNGGAMRVAPVAAYFADDVKRVIEEADRSAEVTHAHCEGRAGAIAAAVAGALAWQRHRDGISRPGMELIDETLNHVPPGVVHDGLQIASKLDAATDLQTAAERLGNGSRITAPDTLPMCLWLAARRLDSFEDAMWDTVQVGGDIDTNCAIVGGIVALAVGRDRFPEEWRLDRESLWRYSTPP